MTHRKCPFCGGGWCVCQIDDDGRFYKAHCQDCDCRISVDKNNEPFRTIEEAENAWDKRYGDEDLETALVLIKALKALIK